MKRGSVLLACVFAALWAVAATSYGYQYSFSSGSSSSGYLLMVLYGITGIFVMALSGWLLSWILRRFSLRSFGAGLGYIVFIPPAVQLGILASAVGVAHVIPDTSSLLQTTAFLFCLVVTSVLVLVLGGLVGVACEFLYRKLIGYFEPVRMARVYRVVFLLALLVGIIVFYRERIEFLYLQNDDGAPHQSAWIEREKTLFSSVLKQDRYDYLVVPFQAEGSSVDRVTRSLMTRLISYSIAQRTGAKLPDPTLVMRAFGDGARTFSDEEIVAFAEGLGVKTVFVSKVARSKADGLMSISVVAKFRDSAQPGSEWKTIFQKKWRDIPFSDDTPPFQSFRAIVDVVVSTLPLGKQTDSPQSIMSKASGKLPTDPSELVGTSAGSAIDQALALQLFASLHERNTIASEHLWERSLIALEQVAPGSDYFHLLKSRAYFHLHRRPLALALLGQPRTPEETTFYGILQGNLPLAEAEAEKIQNDALRLMTKIEIEDLRYDYDKIHGYNDRRETLEKQFPGYRLLANLRFSQGDWFSWEMYPAVAGALTASGVQFAPPTTRDYFELAKHYLKWLYFISDSNFQFNRTAIEIERSYPQLWQSKVRKWERMPAQAKLVEWDYFDLLYSLNRSTVKKNIYSILSRQALTQRALDQIDEVSEVFDGYPLLTYYKADALYQKSEASDDLDNKALVYLYSRLARDVYVWEGGETTTSFFAERLIDDADLKYDKYDDEPMRPYRTDVPHGRIVMHSVKFSKQAVETRIVESKRKLAYVQSDFSVLQNLDKDLRDIGRLSDADKLLKENEDRFVGSKYRFIYLAGRLEKTGKEAAAEKLYSDAIKTDPEDWSNYSQLGRLLTANDKYQEAQQMFLSYPLFRDINADHVVMSNRAYEAGMWIYNGGEVGLSKPLFKLAEAYHTGSAAEMHSSEILALTNNKLSDAIKYAQLRYERYNDYRAATNYLIYLFLTKNDLQAWANFKTLEPRYSEAEFWNAALIGNHIKAITDTTLGDWILDYSASNPNRDFLSRALRERYTFIALFLDRPVSADALEIMKTVGQKNNGGHLYYYKKAIGYTALRSGDYGTAINVLTPMCREAINLSVNRKLSLNDGLLYVALAHIKSGKLEEFKKLLEEHRTRVGEDFDYFLAQALVYGYSGDHGRAAKSLKLAFAPHMVSTGTRAFLTIFQLFEAAEFLYLDTKQEIYRDLILNWTRRVVRTYPESTAYAFIAKYTPSSEERVKALGMAMYLDPRSERIQGFSAQENAAAKAWFDKNNPYSLLKLAAD